MRATNTDEAITYWKIPKDWQKKSFTKDFVQVSTGYFNKEYKARITPGLSLKESLSPIIGNKFLNEYKFKYFLIVLKSEGAK